ncbi:MAG TPA: MmgE/PrpD family protein [Burkholderiales bacterium]|nr:MmgE/PrpD family protein [Burkholderiales bacterium]
MDATLQKLTDFICTLGYADLTPGAIHECKRRFIDSLACAIGGYNAEPCVIARQVAGKASSRKTARVFGTLDRTTPELAAFANGVMIRYLDLNDATGSGGGHPSDAFAALLAVTDHRKTDGKTFLLASIIVYELYLGFFAGNRIRNRGWDHVVYTALAAAAGIAKILGLDHARTANALALVLTPNMALEVVRRGQLTMWKGCAGGNACRNAVFATELAAAGMTGPTSVFEGEQGLWNAAGKFDWPALPGPQGHFRVADSQLKIYPCEYHGQSPIEAMLAIRDQIDPQEVEAIVVTTYWFAWSEIGSEPEKWNPTTRETADHSIPFLVSAALLFGWVDATTYAPENLFDPRLRELIAKVEVIHDKELDKMQPQSVPCRLVVKLKNGERKVSNIDHPRGHVRNPASDQDIEKKFRGLSAGALSARRISRLLKLCWKLDELDDVSEVVTLMRMNAPAMRS